MEANINAPANDDVLITVGFSMLPPYCVPKFNSNGNITGLLGNHGEIIHSILQYYNWKAKFIMSDEEGFGIRDENGSWSSVMGLLTRNEIDISPPFHMSLERSLATPFSIPVLYEEVTFATRAPEYISKMFIIIKPFSVAVWCFCVLTVICFGILMSYMTSILRRKRTNRKSRAFIPDVIDKIVTPGLYNDRIKTKRMSWRMAVFSWSFFMLILSVTYSGTLISFMTSPFKGEPVDKLETLVELVNEKHYYAGSLPGLVMNYLVEIAAGTNNLKLKYPAHTRSPSKNRKDAPIRMLNERYAFVWLRFWFTDIFLEMGENALHRFHVASDSLMSMLLALGISQKSNLKRKIDKVIIIQLESGLISKWTDDILIRSRVEGMRYNDFTDEEYAENYRDSSFTPLTLYQCSSGFFVLGLGYGISILVFLREMRASYVRYSYLNFFKNNDLK